MTLRLYPDPILLQKALPIEKVTPELQQVAKDMYALMKEHNGVGLSAPQVGLSIRLIVAEIDGHAIYMFNPVIAQFIGTKHLDDEGCLSFNYGKDFKKIKRHPEIKIKYRDFNGKVQYNHFKGLAARIVQHELDHLNGITFLEKEESQ